MTEQTPRSKFEQQRREKLEKIRALGMDPYGRRLDGVQPAAGVKAGYADDREGQRARCAGRIVLLRDIGKLIFITLRDSSGTIQLGLSRKLLDAHWEFIKLLDLGDMAAAEGSLGKTKTGEITIWVESSNVFSNALLPPPLKFKGLWGLVFKKGTAHLRKKITL